MLEIIVKAIFWVVGKIGDIILLPITTIINLAVPNISVNLDKIFDFLQSGFNWIPFWLKSFCVPSECVLEILLVFTVYYSLIISLRVYHLVLRLYNKFKP